MFLLDVGANVTISYLTGIRARAVARRRAKTRPRQERRADCGDAGIRAPACGDAFGAASRSSCSPAPPRPRTLLILTTRGASTSAPRPRSRADEPADRGRPRDLDDLIESFPGARRVGPHGDARGACRNPGGAAARQAWDAHLATGGWAAHESWRARLCAPGVIETLPLPLHFVALAAGALLLTPPPAPSDAGTCERCGRTPSPRSSPPE